MLPDLTQKVLDQEDLEVQEAESALQAILESDLPDATIASFLTALAAKGETAAEIAGFARVMRRLARPLSADHLDNLVDTAGTGGGGETFNISTTASFVIAGSGVPVAKHGNRAVTSRSGSADLLAQLGVDIDLATERAESCLNEIGICFLFAPHFHPAMKRVAAIRSQIGHRSIFNLVGPLANPAGAPNQLIGVWNSKLTRTVAEAFSLLGGRRAWVVHSQDGLDEVSASHPTWVSSATESGVESFLFDPSKELDLLPAPHSLTGGDAGRNAEISRAILANEIRDLRRDVVLLNAAAALHLSRGNSISEAFQQARKSLESGAALEKLEQLVSLTSNAG